MADVFFSYKSEDRDRVAPLVEALIAEGFTVWWDLQIEGGAAWRESIQAQLDAAVCVVVVWSVHSIGSTGHFVQDEASRANRRGAYLPIAIDAVEPPLGFGQHQVMRLIGWRGNRRDPRYLDVLAAVRAAVAGGPRPAPTARRRATVRSGFWPPFAIACAVLALVVGLIIVRAPAKLCAAAGVQCPELIADVRAAPPNSIAVLPFANLSGDASQDYFADGLSEELISTLARVGALQVVGRTSSFSFKGSKESSASIGGKLGVAYLLDGSVRREGEMVRVSTQLVDAKSGFERWSQTYDREMKDIFGVQSGIAEAVAEALKVRLLGGDIAALSHGGTANPQAYDAYLRGRRLFDSGAGEAGYRAALARFDAAIAADPRFAAAYAGRGRTLLALGNLFEPTDRLRATYDGALAATRRAVELAPDLPEAQTTLAGALVYATRDFPGAKTAYDRAMASGGGNADVLTGYGLFNCRVGDCTAGIAALRRAVVLDPLNPRVFKTLGAAYLAARRYPEAIAAMRRALELSPGMSTVHGSIGDALLLQGRYAEAQREYALEPSDWARLAGQAIVLRRLGDQAGARAALAALVAQGDSNAYQLAQVRAQWGDAAGALASLDLAIRLYDAGVLTMKTDPLLDPLRADPRFAARLEKAGLAKSST